MSLTKFAINIACPMKKLTSYNTYLFVGPHPDDIEIGAGATVKKLTDMGKKVIFLICTDGRFGIEFRKDLTYEELITVRKEECIKSAKLLGVSDVRFLGLSDGAMYEYSDMLKGIAKTINEVMPDMILTVDPANNEFHQDHLNCGNACKELALFANFPPIFEKYLDGEKSNNINVEAIAFFMTRSINTYVKVSKYKKFQEDSICIHESQYPRGAEQTNALFLYLKLRRIEFGLKSFKGNADGFYMFDRLRMHCMPESKVK